MQALRASRMASKPSRAPCLSSRSLSTRTISRHFLPATPLCSSYAHSSDPTLRRNQVLFEAVRSLHQTHYLLQAAQKPPAQQATASASTPASTPASTNQEKTQLTTQSISSGTEVEAEKPQKTLSERAKELWATAKYLFKFYFNGVKQIWGNRTRVKEVQARVAGGGSALTREEFQLIRTHESDMRKLPLFLFILLILEEALPLVVIWAPSLLPSTCILPNQLTKIRIGDEVKRAAAYQKLQESEPIKSLLPVVEDNANNLRLTSQHQSADRDLLKDLSSEDLYQVAKIFSLATWGGSAMVRRRLDSHLKYVREDDKLMCSSGDYKSIPQHADALTKACAERGLRATGIEQKELFESLRTWLRYTTRNPDTRSISNSSVALLPLQMYNAAELQDLKSTLEAENQRGLIDKTKDVLREVVEEEKSVVHRTETAKQEIQQKEKTIANSRK